MTRRIGFVSSEGGPYLIADAAAVRAWRGIDGSDYDELCAHLDKHAENNLQEIQFPVLKFLSWDPGIGVVDVLADGERIALIYPSDVISEMPAALGSASFVVKVECGVLAILWAPESGDCITEQDLVARETRSPSGILAIDGSSLLVRVAPGIYRIFIANGVDNESDVRGLLMLPEWLCATKK